MAWKWDDLSNSGIDFIEQMCYNLLHKRTTCMTGLIQS